MKNHSFTAVPVIEHEPQKVALCKGLYISALTVDNRHSGKAVIFHFLKSLPCCGSCSIKAFRICVSWENIG